MAELVDEALKSVLGHKKVHPVERFWAAVEKTNGCWRWLKGHSRYGYGRFGISPNVIVHAHRFAYEMSVAPIPPDRYIDHLCRNRGCVNPAHMEVVDNRTNILRGVSPAAKEARSTHCSKGHPLRPGPNSKRHCQICINAAQFARHHTQAWKDKIATYRRAVELWACPTCKQPMGQGCKTPRGRIMGVTQIHAARYNAWYTGYR